MMDVSCFARIAGLTYNYSVICGDRIKLPQEPFGSPPAPQQGEVVAAHNYSVKSPKFPRYLRNGHQSHVFDTPLPANLYGKGGIVYAHYVIPRILKVKGDSSGTASDV